MRRFYAIAVLLVGMFISSAANAQVVRISLAAAGVDNTAALQIGSTNYGARDSAQQIQAILDLNKTSGLPLIIDWDVRCSIGTTLHLNSNTTIRAPVGAGVILRPHVDLSMFSNSNPTRGTGGSVTGAVGASTPATVGSFGNSCITIDGLTINGNGPNQGALPYTSTGWSDGLRFFGTERLTLRNLQFYTTVGFAVHLGNWFNVVIDSVHIDQNENNIWFSSGFQINGPGQWAVIRNCSIKSGDDQIALNADDGPGAVLPFLYPLPGAISDVLIDGLVIQDGRHGIRLLSATCRIDRITIKNVGGTCADNFMLISNFLDGSGNSQTGTSGPGNFGSITVDGVNVDCTANATSGFDEQHGQIYVESQVDSLSISNWQVNKPSVARDCWLFVSQRNSYAPLRNLRLSNCSYYEATVGNTPPFVLCQGVIDNLVATNCQVYRDPSIAIAANPFVIIDTGDATKGITNLSWTGQTHRVSSIVSLNSGKLNSCRLAGSHTSSSGNGALVIANGLVVKNYDYRSLMTANPFILLGSGSITNNLATGGTFAD